MKVCFRCKKEKNDFEFGDDLNRKDGLCIYCKECRKQQYKEQREGRFSLLKGNTRRRRKAFRRKYGQYIVYKGLFDKLWKEQEGKCAVCKTPFKTEDDATIDHCHRYKNIRGLLCTGCNAGLGNFKDDVERLRGAIDYIKRHQEQIEINGTSAGNTSNVAGEAVVFGSRRGLYIRGF